MFKLAELRCCCRKSSHINVVEKERKCRNGNLVRQKITLREHRISRWHFQHLQQYKNCSQNCLHFSIFTLCSQGFGASGKGREQGGCWAEAALFAVQCCIPSLCLGFLWECWRAVQEHTWVHLRDTEGRETVMPRQGFWAWLCANGIWSVILHWASLKHCEPAAKEGVCPWAFSSLLKIE